MWKQPGKTKEPENLEKAYEYAVFLLLLKLRTVGEVLRKMQVRGYSEKIINDVIERLKDQRYLDDGRYAEIYLENLKTYRTFGFYGIKKKLMEKKLPNALIESLLQSGLSISEEIKIGQRLLAKEGFKIKKIVAGEDSAQYSSYGDGNSPEQKQKQKLVNRMKAKGFRGEVIAKLVF